MCIPLSPQKESRKSLINKRLRLFLCPKSCTKNAPIFDRLLKTHKEKQKSRLNIGRLHIIDTSSGRCSSKI